jgi:hypothetical protein
LHPHFDIGLFFLRLGLGTATVVLSFIAIHLEAAEKVAHESAKIGHHAGFSLRLPIPALQLTDADVIATLYFAH